MREQNPVKMIDHLLVTTAGLGLQLACPHSIQITWSSPGQSYAPPPAPTTLSRSFFPSALPQGAQKPGQLKAQSGG